MNLRKLSKLMVIPTLALLIILSIKIDGALATLAPQSLGTTDQITQFGITWTFDQPYTYGQFANGDFWVIGPVTIVDINPPSTDIASRIMNGTMINPSPQDGNTQGYDNAMNNNNYNPAMNAARPNGQDLSVGNPLMVPTSASVVSSISVAEAGHRPQLQTAAILTVLDAEPPAGSFRPPYVGSDKNLYYNTSQINWALLKQLSPVANTPDIASVADYFERPWLDHIPNWVGRELHPVDNMPDYGRDMSNRVGVGALMLHLDFSNAEKEALLLRYLQLGIDWYGIVQNGGTDHWRPNGGHASGRKWPIMFAGVMLGDAAMKNIGPGDGTGTAYFGEDAQTFYVSQENIDRTHDPDVRGCYAEEYSQIDLGLPEWGIRHATEPERDNKAWCAVYRQCCTGSVWPGFVLAAHIMDMKGAWNHDPLFDYVDRYMNIQGTGSSVSFTEAMWLAYRNDYGVTWPGLSLHGVPVDESTIHLSWDFEGTLPVTTTWHIEYYTQTITPPLSVTGIVSPTRSYDLTGLSSYTWYSVTLYAMLDTTSLMSDTVRVMPTDKFVYLPVTLKE